MKQFIIPLGLLLAAAALLPSCGGGGGDNGGGGASAPAAPINLAARAVSTSQIDLAWTDNSGNERGFEVERSANGIVFTTISTTLSANTTTFSDAGLAVSTTYIYRVRAYNSTGYSGYSNTANAATFTVTTIGGGTGTGGTGGGGSTGSADGGGSCYSGCTSTAAIAAAATFNNPFGIAVVSGPSGTILYVTDSWSHTIRRIALGYSAETTTVSTLAGAQGIPGTADGTGANARFYRPAGITVVSGTTTTLFVADAYNDTIRAVNTDPARTTATFAGTALVAGSADGIGTAAFLNHPYGIATDGTSLFVADTENHIIRQIIISTGTVSTLAGLAGVWGSADGDNSTATFYKPMGIVTDGTYLYVVDTGNNAIRKVEITTGNVTTLTGGMFDHPSGITLVSGPATTLYVADSNNNVIRTVNPLTSATAIFAGTGVPGSADGNRLSATFFQPAGIASDGVYLYVTDYGNYTIRQINIATGEVTTPVGRVGVSRSAESDAVLEFWPYGLVSDSTGTYLYVAEANNNMIRQVNKETGALTILAGLKQNAGSLDGVGPAASFNGPVGIIDAGSYLYVPNNRYNTIRKIEKATGVVTTIAGIPSLSGGYINGNNTEAMFNNPACMATDGAYLYVTDNQNHIIRKIDIATNVVSALTGSTTSGFSDGNNNEALFNLPWGIAYDGSTFLYVVDYGNNAIRKVHKDTGVTTTVAGAGAGNYGSADGIGTAARFYFPTAVAYDAVAIGGPFLYVTDTRNHTIRKIHIAAQVVTTLAGAPGVPGSASGTGSDARFNNPYGVIVDSTGAIYVSDTNNNVIRRIE